MSTTDLARRREAFRRRLAERNLDSDDGGRVRRRHAEEAPLSFAQRRMWLHQQIHPDSHAYNVAIRTTFSGPVDVDALHAALVGVADRQEALRTTYHLADSGEPIQRVHAALPPVFDRLDLRAVSAEERADRLERAISSAASTPFDLAERPVRLLLARCADDEVVVLLVVHHIIWDGLSYACWSRDLTELYAGEQPGPTAVGYADIAAYEQEHWPPDGHEVDREFWTATLGDAPPPPPLPSGRVARGPVGERGGRVRHTLPDGASAALRRIARRHGTTEFVAFLTCHLLVLRRFTGAVDLTVGTTAMERETVGADELVGNFGNTLALRVDTGVRTVGELVGRVADACGAAFSHRARPFDRVVDDVRPPREQGRPPLFDSLVVFLAGEVSGPALPDVDVRFESVFAGATPFPLTVHAFVFPDRFDVDAHFAADLLDEVTVATMVAAMGRALLALAEDPDRAVTDLLPDLRAGLPGPQDDPATHGPPDGPATVAAAVARRAAAEPGAVAVVTGSGSLTYGELMGRARALAGRLAAVGAGPERVVAVATDRSEDLVVGVLGVLVSGSAVLLLDPAHPVDRLRGLLGDSGAIALVAGPEQAPLAPPGLPVVGTDGPERPWTPPPIRPGAAAWIGYTSGSTGVPKAVVVTHAALLARAYWARDRWPVAPGEPRLAKSPVTFVDSISEIVETLVGGGVLVMVDEHAVRDGAAIAGLLRRHGIRHLMAVPGLLAAIADADPAALSGLTRLISTGEALTAGPARTLGALAPLRNSYGCAELAGDVVDGPVPVDVEPGWAFPTGTPGPGVRVLILDPRLEPVAPGVAGDLYIGGPQVARGYHGWPGSTAERFVADPLRTGARLFRTGDRARWGRWGLEVLGRSDDQVKIRGQRVELGEVAEVARGVDGVGDAVASVRPGPSGDRLLLHVVGSADPADVDAHLRRTLPDAMVPAAIGTVPALPRLPNGKVDRSALPEPAIPRAAPRRAASTPAERELCRILGDVVGVADVRPDEDFFALGGDSISAIGLVAAARRAGWSFDVAAVFSARTAAGLAALVPAAVAPSRAVTLHPQAHRLRRARVAPGAAALLLRMPGTPPIADLERALAIVAGRHEALRLRIEVRRRGLWRATVGGEPAPPPVVGGTAVDACTALDPAAGRPLAAAIGPDGTVLAGLAVALDGPSMAMVAAEVTAVLAGDAVDGPGWDWPRSPAPAAGDRWTALLRDVPLDRPSGLPAPVDAAPAGRCRSDPDPTLAGLAEDTLVAGFAIALRGWSGHDTIAVDRVVRRPVGGVGPLTDPHPLVVSGEDGVAAVAARARDLAGEAGGYAALRHGTADGARTFAGLAEPDARVEVGPAGVEPADVAPHRVAAVAGADGALLVATGPGLPADLAPHLVQRWRTVLAR